MPKIDILGVEHNYEITPNQSDTTLVFVHGWLLSREYWQPIISEMSRDFTCLSYDLRGFGRSKMLPSSVVEKDSSVEPILEFSSAQSASKFQALGQQRRNISLFSPAAYAHDLLVLLQKLQIQKAWLVGHSLGGTIAVWAAAIAPPNSIQGLICLNSGGGIYVADEFEKFRRAGSQILKYRPQWLAKIPGLDWVFSRMNVAKAVDRKWGSQLLTDFLRVQELAGQHALLDSTTREEVLYLPQIMQTLSQPAYFIAGAQDTVMEPKYVKHLASFHDLFEQQGNNLFQIPDCGHLSMIEQPQQVNQILKKVLQMHPI